MKYSKPALSNADLLARWQAKGLQTPQPLDAEQALTFAGYFRLRGYALSLMQSSPTGRVFIPGVTFNDILAMSLQYGPFWCLNYPHQVLAHAPGSQGKPSECVSFGKWSRLYKHLHKADSAHPNPKKTIAKTFGLAVPLMESWLHALSVLRNICAHHGRVWNRKFGYRPETDQRIKPHFANQQSYYCLAVVMRLFSRMVDTHDEWPVRLLDLFKSNPTIAPADLGFPSGWEQDPLWN